MNGARVSRQPLQLFSIASHMQKIYTRLSVSYRTRGLGSLGNCPVGRKTPDSLMCASRREPEVVLRRIASDNTRYQAAACAVSSFRIRSHAMISKPLATRRS